MNNSYANLVNLSSRLRSLANNFIEQRLKEEGINSFTASHGSIMAVLYSQGSQTMAGLSFLIQKDKSTVTVLVRKLERLGYIKKISDLYDNRVKKVSLTEKGILFQPIFEKISEELNAGIWKDFSLQDKKLLCDLLNKVIKQFS